MSNERVNLQVTSGGISYGILAKLREEKIVAGCENLSGSVWTGIMKLVAEDEDARAQYAGGSNFITGTSDVTKKSWINNFRIKVGQSLSFTKELWSKIVQYVQTGKVTETPKPKVVAESDSEVIASDLEDAKANVQARKRLLSETGNIRVQMGLNDVTSEKVVPEVETGGIYGEISDDDTEYSINNNDGTISITKDGKTETRQMTPEEKGLDPQQLVANLEAAKAAAPQIVVVEEVVSEYETGGIYGEISDDDTEYSINNNDGTISITKKDGETVTRPMTDEEKALDPQQLVANLEAAKASSKAEVLLANNEADKIEKRTINDDSINGTYTLTETENGGYILEHKFNVLPHANSSAQAFQKGLTSSSGFPAIEKDNEGYYNFRGMKSKNYNTLSQMVQTESNNFAAITAVYQDLQSRQSSGETLTSAELKFMEDYVQSLEGYGLQFNANGELEDMPATESGKNTEKTRDQKRAEARETRAEARQARAQRRAEVKEARAQKRNEEQKQELGATSELSNTSTVSDNAKLVKEVDIPDVSDVEDTDANPVEVSNNANVDTATQEYFANDLDSYKNVMAEWQDGYYADTFSRNGVVYTNVEAITLNNGQRAWKSDEGVFYPFADGKIGGKEVPVELIPTTESLQEVDVAEKMVVEGSTYYTDGKGIEHQIQYKIDRNAKIVTLTEKDYSQSFDIKEGDLNKSDQELVEGNKFMFAWLIREFT